MSYLLILLPFSEAAIEPAPSLHPGDHGIARRAVDFPEAAQLAAPTKGDVPVFVPGFDPEIDADDPGPDTPDDVAAPDDADDRDDTECDPAAGDPGLRYLPPAAAVKWLKSQGFDVDLTGLRRLVRDGNGPPIAWFTTGQGGWRIRADMLAQWVDWQRFQASWSARERIAA